MGKESRDRECTEGMHRNSGTSKFNANEGQNMNRYGLMFLDMLGLRRTWHERKVQLCDVRESEFIQQRLHRTLLPSPHLATKIYFATRQRQA